MMALVFCALVRLILFASTGVLDKFPGPYDVRQFLGVEQHFIRDTEVPPRVLLFGSSRMRYSIVPELFAKEMDIPRSSVQNLAVDQGGPWDALKMLERNPDLLDSVDLVIIDCECWHFNAGHEAFPTPRFFRLVSASERLDSVQGIDRFKWTVDIAWPFQLERRSLRDWLGGCYTISMGGGFPVPRPNKWDFEDNPNVDFAFEPVRMSLRHTRNFRIDENARIRWQSLLEEMSNRGIAVLVMRPPTHSEYTERMKTVTQCSKAYSTYVRIAKSLANNNTHVKIWEFPADCGLDDKDFLDYGHMTSRGAKKFTKFLADYIRMREMAGEKWGQISDRGRDGPFGSPPAPIPANETTAPGSCLEL